MRRADHSFRGTLQSVCVFIIVCDVETSTMRRPKNDLSCSSPKETVVLG